MAKLPPRSYQFLLLFNSANRGDFGFSPPPAPKGARRFPTPTMKEAGFPALEFSEWFGILLPTKTDMEIATSLNGVVRNAMKTDEFKSRLVKLSLEPAGSSMSDFAQRMRADTARWAPIIKASGFAAD